MSRLAGNPSLGKMQMPNNKQSTTQRKTIWTYLFDKRLGAVACAIVAVLSGLAYFRKDLPTLKLSSVSPQPTERTIPAGSILLPYDNHGTCRLHAIDNATGKIQDDGFVNCLDASDENAATWKSFGDQAKASGIRKSFGHQ